MSNFTDFIAKTSSRKTILFEMDYGELTTKWYNYRSGIWAKKLKTYFNTADTTFNSWGHGRWGHGTWGHAGAQEVGEDNTYWNLASCKVAGTQYTLATTIESCVVLDSSYYYDYSDDTLYLHCVNYTEPQTHTVIVGLQRGFSNRPMNLNDKFYEPKIDGGVTISKTKDSMTYGMMSFDGGQLTLTNQGGYFDSLFDSYIFGQPAKILFGGDDLAYGDYRTMFQGYIGNIILDEDKVEISVIDDRKALSLQIPPNVFDSTTYPNIKAKNIGKPIPLCWGTCLNVTCVCTNEADASAANYTFVVADVTDHDTFGIQGIDTVYVNGESVAIASTSVISGIFNISTDHYNPGQTTTADVRGYVSGPGGGLIHNSLSVIEDINDTYAGKVYGATYYDTTTWVAEKSNAYNIGLFIDKKTKIRDVIAQIAKSNMANFLIKDDGLYSWLKYDSTDAATFTIEKYEVGDRLSPKHDAEDYLTSVSVGYSKDHNKRSYARYLDESQETDIYALYNHHQHVDYDTLLTNATDAQTVAEALMDYMKDPRMVMTNTVGVRYMEKDIGNIANLNGDRPEKAWMGSIKCEIVGIYKELSDNPKVTLVGREVPS